MSRVTDIRLRTNFFTDINTIRLVKACGDSGVSDLLKLWLYAAEHHPNGTLTGLKDDEIGAVINITSKQFLEELEKNNFIKRTKDDWVEIVNWEVDQAWVVGAPERSEKARKAAHARYSKDKIKNVENDGEFEDAEICPE